MLPFIREQAGAHLVKRCRHQRALGAVELRQQAWVPALHSQAPGREQGGHLCNVLRFRNSAYSVRNLM